MNINIDIKLEPYGKICYWGNYGEAKGIILLIHGLLANCQWFTPLTAELARLGYYCLSFDMPNIANFNTFSESIDQVEIANDCRYQDWLTYTWKIIKNIQKTYPDKPLYILGNSLGSVITTNVLNNCNNEIKGVVLLSAGFNGNKQKFNLKYVVSTLLTCFCFPEKLIELPYGMQLVTNNQQILTNYSKENFKIKAKILLEVLKLTKTTKVLSLNQRPLLMLLAQNDWIVDNQTNLAIFNNLKNKAKMLFVINNAFHDLILAEHIDETVQKIDTFLTQIK